MTNKKTGTKEWAEHSKNIMLGCQNDCKYCYARSDALRWKRIGGSEEWCEPIPNNKALEEKPRKLKGRIMHPTTHDLKFDDVVRCLFGNILYYRDYLANWLDVGNDFLITSKPEFKMIKFLCDHFTGYKDHITFRFTIGSTDNDVLRFWEPNAPLFAERLHALEYAYEAGYKTSVSIEPMLDWGSIELCEILEPYVTDTIWIGTMNKVKSRVDMTNWGDVENGFLKKLPSDDDVEFIHSCLHDNPKIRWKDSIRDLLGLPKYEGVG